MSRGSRLESHEPGHCDVESVDDVGRGTKLRQNTVRIDLSQLGYKPCVFQQQEFVEHELGVRPEDIVRLQYDRRQRCLFLKMHSIEACKNLVGMHNGRHRFPLALDRPRIRLSIEDSPTEVLIHDLSEMVSDNELKMFLGQYGLVLAVKHGYWTGDINFAHILNGQRRVIMVVRNPIPSVVRIGGEETRLTYSGQPPPKSSLIAGMFYLFARCFGTTRNRHTIRHQHQHSSADEF